jgi:hypothetical protein
MLGLGSPSYRGGALAVLCSLPLVFGLPATLGTKRVLGHKGTPVGFKREEGMCRTDGQSVLDMLVVWGPLLGC